MEVLLGSCLGLISGSEWQDLRRVSEYTFLRHSTTLHTPNILSNARSYLTSLDQKRTASAIKHEVSGRESKIITLHPVDDLKIYPFLTVAQILYGDLTPSLEQRLLALVPIREQVFRHIIQGGITRFRASQFLPLQVNRSMATFKAEWAHWNDDAHAAAVIHKKIPDTIQPAILPMYDAVANGTTSREHVLQTLDEMLFANLDVSIGAMSWPLVFIAAHPSVQHALLDEIATVTGSCGDSNLDEKINSYLFSSTTYLHSILLESARLRPLAAFSVPQSCPTPRLVGGYIVPAGTPFIVDTHALNIRNDVWGPDNTSFRPERWREGQKGLRYSYWRFGFGPRLCLGKYVADSMMKAMILELVTQFELSMDEESGWRRVEESWILHPDMEIKCERRTEM